MRDGPLIELETMVGRTEKPGATIAQGILRHLATVYKRDGQERLTEREKL